MCIRDSSWTIRRLGPRLRAPERRLRRVEARRGLRRAPRAAPKTNILGASNAQAYKCGCPRASPVRFGPPQLVEKALHPARGRRPVRAPASMLDLSARPGRVQPGVWHDVRLDLDWESRTLRTSVNGKSSTAHLLAAQPQSQP